MIDIADKVSIKKASEFELTRPVLEIQRLHSLTNEDLVRENIAAKIPLIDPKKPKKKNVDVS